MSAREERRLQMVQTIVRAAAVEFAERGYAATSYGLIADRAGVAKSLVSYHFASKSMVALEILDRAFAGGIFLEPEARAQNPVAELVSSTRSVASTVVAEPLARAAMRLQAERGLLTGDVPVPFVGWTRRTEGLLRAASEASLLSRDLDPAEEARLLVATFIGLKYMAEAHGEWDDLPRRAVAATVTRLLALGAARRDLNLADAER